MRRAQTYTSPKKTRKSAAPATYHDQIISDIKNKYSKDAINEMSQEQLASEILNMQSRSKRNEPAQQTGEFGDSGAARKGAYEVADDGLRNVEVDAVEDEDESIARATDGRHDRSQ